ncbi:hypothetical protein D3C85_1577480 [compost metagenome]
MRPGLQAYFGIDVGGADLDLSRWRLQVTDAAEEIAIGRHVAHRSRVGAVPGIQFGLQAIPFGQQRAVLRRQFMH